MFKWMDNIDRRWIYVLLLALILWPLVNPIGMPVRVSPWTTNFYREIEKLLPGDRVVLSADYSAGSAPDVHPQVEAVFKHLMEKNARVIGVAFSDQGVMYLEELFKTFEKQGKKYGVDFCDLGYLTGGETAMAAFASDMTKAAPVDFRKNATTSLPIMDGVKNITNTKLVLDFAAGVPGPAEWVRQVGAKYKVPMVCGVVTVMGPQQEPYIQSGQLKGLLTGLRGAAEYEVILKSPGRAVAAMDAQSMGHAVIIAFILLGNIAHYYGKRSISKKATGGDKL